MSLTVLIPAHNEEACVGDAVDAAFALSPKNVIVVSDNSTDKTDYVARAHGARVFETVGNTAKKAGALNQALEAVLPGLWEHDRVLVVDADSRLSPAFAKVADELLEQGPDIAAVGGVFIGERPTNLIELCQSNEYARYAREVTRTKRTMVLSGTSSYFRVTALRAVYESRGYYYDPTALTEDNEMSLALKTLGYRIASPEECSVTTELMPTVGDLYRQRVRWFRGAVENLRDYGWTKVTARYWFQQIMLTWGLLMMMLLVVLTGINLTMFGLSTHWFWLLVTALFVVERLITVWARGTTAGRVLSLMLIPELMYSMILYAAFVVAVVKAVKRTDHQWSHMEKAN